MTLTERLRESLRRTREKLGLSEVVSETPDWDALEESLVLADVGLPATREILEKLRARSGNFRENLRSILVEMLSPGSRTSPSSSPKRPRTRAAHSSTTAGRSGRSPSRRARSR